MNSSIKTGVSFGLTSGIITTLGLIVGLNSGTSSKLAIIGGILTIAVADSLSDALGIHISEEVITNNVKKVWQASISTFVAKFLSALFFIIPFLIFQLTTAIIICVILGLLILAITNYYIAKIKNIGHWKIIFEHLLIAVIVVIITHYLGKIINIIFTV